MSGNKPDTILDDSPDESLEVAIQDETTDKPESFITTIELIRHGKLEGDDTLRGITDDPLSDSGWDQMVSTLDDKDNWDIIVSSPLLSCREFAEVIAKEDDTELQINDNLQEIDFGDWEDHTLEDLMKINGELLTSWWQSPTQVTPPNGEDFHDFRARVLKAVKLILHENQGQRILIITHSAVIRVILMKILGMNEDKLFSLNVEFASYSKIQFENDVSEYGTLIKHC